MKELIKQLVETYGPSGREGAVRALISGIIREHVDEIRTDAIGNLVALKKGTGGGKRVMVAAHMDEIGVIVTHIDKKGFARFHPVGGVSALTLTGSRVLFGNGVSGVIGWDGWRKSKGMPELVDMFIDTGATSEEDAPIQVGDMACFDRPFRDLGDRLTSKAMDDRIACAVALQSALDMGESPNDVYFVFTAQEEVGTRGAMTAAFGIDPEVAVAVDVTLTGDTPEAKPMSVSLGDGPAIKIKDSGMLAHPGVKDWMIRKAEEIGVPYQKEVLWGGTTDAYSIQTTRAGIPAGCMSIPTRYVHTPSEIVDYQDVLNCVKLMVAMLEGDIAI